MKNYKDDDGRVIANMDGLEQRGVISSWFGILSPGVREEVIGRAKSGDDSGAFGTSNKNAPERGAYDARNMGVETEFTREDRWALIKYTMKYSLGIGLVFLGAFAILIILLFKLW